MRLKMLDKEKNVVDEQSSRFTSHHWSFHFAPVHSVRQSHIGAPATPPPEAGRTCQRGTVAACSLETDQGRGKLKRLI